MESQQDKLRRHFAGRVTTQARVVLEAWQQLKQQNWADAHWISELQHATDKLGRYAARFDMHDHLKLAQSVNSVLKKVALHASEPVKEQSQSLDDLFDQLAQLTGRKDDHASQEEIGSDQRTYLKAPIYICLNSQPDSYKVLKQLEFFGFRGERYSRLADLEAAILNRRPEVLVMDVDFGGRPKQGIALTKLLQARIEAPVPTIFIADRTGSIELRLEASRAGGEEFIEGSGNTSRILEKIEQYTRHHNQDDPYRVLVVDDSKAQAAFMESSLKKAGMPVRTVTNPMDALEAFQEFEPEIVIMDMYMPGCSGTELARVLRQDDRFMSIPIIYLSAEEDINKQLDAMSVGGDDFLVKPINPKHLVATIHNRGRRARTLNALMVRDSLTRLYNHTHILSLLERAVSSSRNQDQPLTIAMLDIDKFKSINDTYGHPAGDRVLKTLSLFMQQRLRKSDAIGRYGGEEFMVVLNNTSMSDAIRVMNDVRESFSELSHPMEDQEIHVTFSCGLASLETDDTVQILAKRADVHLYEAKHRGRNRVIPEKG